MRGVIFLSHANPEENAFVTWLAAQLVTAGYEVWCDVTKLLGGERFWRDIEEAIDAHTFRFLFVSTLETNRKSGTLRELKLAIAAQESHGLGDFIIPLKIDDFPFASMDARLRDLNFMRFDQGWPAALAKLLKLLEREGAPMSPLASASAVTEWRQRSFDSRRRVQVGEEAVYSNWFRVTLPEKLWFHDLGLAGRKLEQAVSGYAFPHRLHADRLVSFASPPEVQLALGPKVALRRSDEVRTEDFIANGDEALEILQSDASNIVTGLLGQAWNRTLEEKGLASLAMASGALAWFFRKDQLPNNRAHFTRPKTQKKTFRQLVGSKSKRTRVGEKAPDGHWHYAVSALPQLHPFPRLVLRHHVIFTDDGETPWKSAERMLKARRSVCKRWWNAEWRDRLFAMLAALGEGGDELTLSVSDDAAFAMSTQPMSFVSPRRFLEDNECGIDESGDIELVEDADEDDEQEDDGER